MEFILAAVQRVVICSGVWQRNEQDAIHALEALLRYSHMSSLEHVRYILVKSDKQQQYFEQLEFEMQHRKKWLEKPVLNKRYIRGILNNQIKEKIHSRDTGDRTTDRDIRLRALQKTDGRCYLCWRKWSPAQADLFPLLYFSHLQIDHIIPFSLFGPNDVSNYMPICSKCNNRKSNLSLAEYKAGVRKPAFKRK